MPTKFSANFREQAVKKYLERKEGTLCQDLASELGVSYGTLKRWVKSANEITDPTIKDSPNSWPSSKKLLMVSHAMKLEEPELGAYCREQGVYQHQILAWQKEFETMKSATDQVKSEREKVRLLKSENSKLERELKRKDKALAEAAALLVLQKKVQAMFAQAEES